MRLHTVRTPFFDIPLGVVVVSIRHGNHELHTPLATQKPLRELVLVNQLWAAKPPSPENRLLSKNSKRLLVLIFRTLQ